MESINQLIKNIEGKRVYLDTNPIIYFLDGIQSFSDICFSLFHSIDEGKVFAYSGELCLAELLVKPLRENNIQQVGIIQT